MSLLAVSLASLATASPAPNWASDSARERAIYAQLRELSLAEKVQLLHGTAKMYSGGAPRLGIAEVAYTDGPLGVREELERDSWKPLGLTDDFATYFPTSSALAATWNRELSREYGIVIGAETRARGKDVLLAPAINLMRSPLCGRTYEYFSEDPVLVSALVAPYVQGVQSQDVAACVKHFAVNNQETNRRTINAVIDERTLRELYLPGFKAAVVEGEAYSIMAAYNKVRGQHVCENHYLLNDILKDEWGFPGFVVSDWEATHSTIPSALNGLDVEMGTKVDYPDYFFADALLEAVQNGELSESVVDGMALRVLRVLYEIGKTDPDRATGELRTPKHDAIALKVAEEAIVLLRNDDELLPLDASNVRRVAVIGDNAVRTHALGGFGAGVKTDREVTPLEGIRNYLGESVEVVFAQGYEPAYNKAKPTDPSWGSPINYDVNPALLEEAVATAKEADVVIFVGGTNRFVESEAADRTTLRLPFAQEAILDAILEVNQKTVVAMVAGAPVDLSHTAEVAPALVWAWFNGSESGTALAHVLFGEVNPSGRLPFTIPEALDDLGPHALDAFPGDGEKVVYEEGILVGYRWLDKHGLKARFPFGYGLSYTSFEYTDFAVSDDADESGNIIASVTLKNSGTRAGADTIQLYVSKPTEEMEQAEKQLIAFEKVTLVPGEEKTVKISIPREDLASYDVNHRAWRVLAGKYVFSVARSTESLIESTTYRVAP
jgi:beta-glucosidase